MPSTPPPWSRPTVGPQRALPTAVARELSITRGELAGPGWRSPYRGLVAPSTPSVEHPLQRICDAVELLPPGAALGGWAAAYLLGARELDGCHRGQLQPVPLVVPQHLSIRPRPGIVLSRSALAEPDLTVVSGITCTSVVRTAFDLARLAPLRDAVVALDVIGHRLGLHPAAVTAYAGARPGWKGQPVLRRAIALADPRSLSPGETRLRLVWVLDAHLPVPEVNPGLYHQRGYFLGMVDLLDPEAALVGEFDGAHHRHAGAHAADNAREEWLEDSGLVVVRAGTVDLGERARTVLRLRTAYRRGLARDRGRDQWFVRSRPMPAAPGLDDR